MVRLRVPLLSLGPGVCVISTWISCLQASLSSEWRDLRQIVMSSALGMNSLHSLNTSGVHARRCSGVPCGNEGVGQAVASSTQEDTHHRAKDLACRGVRPRWLFIFIQIFALGN
jgi:hypothetical protein